MLKGQRIIHRRDKLFSALSKTMSTLKEQKIQVRKDIAQRLAELSREEKEKQSEIVVKKVISSPEFQCSKRISIFLSTEDEINTKPIIERIFQENKECFVPRYSKIGMEMVKLHSMEDWENLPVTSWNIKQPKLKEERENALKTGGLDLLIVPGVAFTKNGKRLGHGGGYYDKYIRNIKENQESAAVIVAVAFKEQICDDIPTDIHDQIIEKILCVE